jgi:hypothetical protein
MFNEKDVEGFARYAAEPLEEALAKLLDANISEEVDAIIREALDNYERSFNEPS